MTIFFYFYVSQKEIHMKKVILIIAFFIVSFAVNAQAVKIIKSVNDAGDVATFELDCSVLKRGSKMLRF